MSLERRTPLRRNAPMPRGVRRRGDGPSREQRGTSWAGEPQGGHSRSRLRPVSTKKLGKAAERRLVVAVVLERDGNRCQAHARGLEHTCYGPVVVHELIPRSLWAAGYLVVDNCLAVCAGVNSWVEENTARAIELDLARPSWERP